MSYGSRPGAREGDRAERPTAWLYGDRLRMVGVKLFADGALGSRGAWLKQPYADEPDTRGLQFHSRRRMLEHWPTSRGARLPDCDPRDRRRGQRADHRRPTSSCSRKYGATGAGGSSMPRSSIRRTCRASAPAGIIASMQPTHQTSDRLMAEARLGPDRLAGAYAWQSMLKRRAARVRVGLPGRNRPIPSPACPRRSAGRT